MRLDFTHSKFNIGMKCNKAIIESMHHNKTNISYLAVSERSRSWFNLSACFQWHRVGQLWVCSAVYQVGPWYQVDVTGGWRSPKITITHSKYINSGNHLIKNSFWRKHYPVINAFWPSDVIWCHGSGSTLAQVMACCLMAPSHYLNQCWLIIYGLLWHAPGSTFTESVLRIQHNVTLIKKLWF